MAFFEATSIDKNYSGYQALNNVSISIEKGQVFGLLGPNGAGKTTLIRIINQITAPDSGAIFFDGHKLNGNDIYNIGYLPEERGLYKKMKVGEQALYLAQLKGLDRQTAQKRLKYWFEKFEIESWRNKKLMELSKGMQQKVQFICTILHEPQLLIFDEPFSGFDPINANLLKREILELRDKGATIIFSTHNMNSVEEICDHIALLNKSKKILDGDIHEVKSRFRTNTFDICYKGDFDKIAGVIGDKFTITSHKEEPHVNRLTISMPGNSMSSNNNLIELLVPHIEIVSFNERIPNMNDIFIQMVESSNKN